MIKIWNICNKNISLSPFPLKYEIISFETKRMVENAPCTFLFARFIDRMNCFIRRRCAELHLKKSVCMYGVAAMNFAA